MSVPDPVYSGAHVKTDERVVASLTRCLYCSTPDLLVEIYSAAETRWLQCNLCRSMFVVPERRRLELMRVNAVPRHRP